MFGVLTEVTAGGSSAPIGWWDGANRQVAPGRPHGGGRILTTCTFLRLRGRGRRLVPTGAFSTTGVGSRRPESRSRSSIWDQKQAVACVVGTAYFVGGGDRQRQLTQDTQNTSKKQEARSKKQADTRHKKTHGTYGLHTTDNRQQSQLTAVATHNTQYTTGYVSSLQ